MYALFCNYIARIRMPLKLAAHARSRYYLPLAMVSTERTGQKHTMETRTSTCSRKAHAARYGCPAIDTLLNICIQSHWPRPLQTSRRQQLCPPPKPHHDHLRRVLPEAAAFRSHGDLMRVSDPGRRKAPRSVKTCQVGDRDHGGHDHGICPVPSTGHLAAPKEWRWAVTPAFSVHIYAAR